VPKEVTGGEGVHTVGLDSPGGGGAGHSG
jgi:hypothetical protein